MLEFDSSTLICRRISLMHDSADLNGRAPCLAPCKVVWSRFRTFKQHTTEHQNNNALTTSEWMNQKESWIKPICGTEQKKGIDYCWSLLCFPKLNLIFWCWNCKQMWRWGLWDEWELLKNMIGKNIPAFLQIIVPLLKKIVCPELRDKK